MDKIIAVMAMVGFCTLFAVVALVGNFALDELDGFINRKKREYQYKHRFDKPPTAECYCFDCEEREENGRCLRFNYWMIDTGFCSFAEPRKSEVKKDG